jgi:hypothetical protein
MNTLDPRTVQWMEATWRQDGDLYRRKYITPHPDDGALVSWTAMIEPHPAKGWRFSLRQNHMSEVSYQSVEAAQLACQNMIVVTAATAPPCTP